MGKKQGFKKTPSEVVPASTSAAPKRGPGRPPKKPKDTASTQEKKALKKGAAAAGNSKKASKEGTAAAGNSKKAPKEGAATAAPNGNKKGSAAKKTQPTRRGCPRKIPAPSAEESELDEEQTEGKSCASAPYLLFKLHRRWSSTCQSWRC